MTWKALYVNSRSEKKVVERLTELGIEAYVPLKKEIKQWSDRKKTVITPLINGYVFVQVNDHQRENVFKVNGVIQYVRFNGNDAIIREEEITVLKSIEEKGYYAEAKPLSMIAGDRAEILYGPFKGLTGTVERSREDAEYLIFLESIGYSVRVKLPAEVLSKINSTEKE